MFDGLTNSQIDDLSNSLDPTKAAFYENAWNYWTTGW